MTRVQLFFILCITAIGGVAFAAEKPTKPASKPASKPALPEKDDWQAPMDYGPFLQTSVARPAGKLLKNESFSSPLVPKFPIDIVPDMIAYKGIVIPVGTQESPATICFDTDTLAMTGWTGGWLDLRGSMFTNHKGTAHVTMQGKEQFHVAGPGCGGGADGSDFADPRKEKLGPLPEEWGRYQGLYVNGNQVALSYRAGNAGVLETVSFEAGDGDLPGTFQRIIRVEPTARPVSISIAEIPGSTAMAGSNDKNIALVKDDLVFVVQKPFEFGELRQKNGRVWITFASAKNTRTAIVRFRSGSKTAIGDPTQPLVSKRRFEDIVMPDAVITAGPAHWKPITVAGKLGAAAKDTKKSAGDPAFIADTLTLPEPNPYNSWFRLTGVDFFSDGRAAIVTINGDVWVCSGIDDSLAKLTWTRFATGLYQPMGLKIVNDVVYVRGRDQITALHDLNKDGEADFYENFCNLGITHPSYHGFVFDLQTDPQGNWYYARGGLGMEPNLEGHGRIIQLSKDGKKESVIGTGLRAPNGLGAGPQGWVTVSDNQGNWVPSSPIFMLVPNPAHPSFLGFMPHHHMAEQPKEPTPPLCWIPHSIDNSSGGECYIDSDRWGSYKGQWIHTSFGAACAFVMLPDSAASPGEVPKQGAVIRIPLDFATGIMRPRFNPKDGQLYAVGVGGGWQTKGTADGGLYRIRHSGKPGFVPSGFAVTHDGIKLTFPQPLDKQEGADPQNYAVEQWNYKWTEKYGSPEYSAKNPTKAMHDVVDVKSVDLSPDGKTVTLHLGGLIPVNQMMIQCNLKTAAGAEFQQEIYATINAVPAK
jgi:hypothetical protein